MSMGEGGSCLSQRTFWLYICIVGAAQLGLHGLRYYMFSQGQKGVWDLRAKVRS